MVFILKVFNKFVIKHDRVVRFVRVRAVGRTQCALIQYDFSDFCFLYVQMSNISLLNFTQCVCHLTWCCSNHVTKWSGLLSLKLKGVSHCYRPLGMRYKYLNYRPGCLQWISNNHHMKELGNRKIIPLGMCTRNYTFVQAWHAATKINPIYINAAHHILISFLQSIFKGFRTHLSSSLK